MALDPGNRETSIAYEGGTVKLTVGLAEYMFPGLKPAWGAGSIATTASGRKRYKYGTRRRDNNAAGKEVFLDFGDDGVWSVRVTGNVVDFIEQILPKVGNDKLRQAWTKRGQVYAPTFPDL
jgi:hypothetical protein